MLAFFARSIWTLNAASCSALVCGGPAVVYFVMPKCFMICSGVAVSPTDRPLKSHGVAACAAPTVSAQRTANRFIAALRIEELGKPNARGYGGALDSVPCALSAGDGLHRLREAAQQASDFSGVRLFCFHRRN